MVDCTMPSDLQARRKALQDTRAKLHAAQQKPVRLRVAAALLQRNLSGLGRSAMRGPDYMQQVEQTAAQLARVVDLYHVHNGRLLRVASAEIAGATFFDGGNLMRSAAGTLYRSVSVRRGEAMNAIEALARARSVVDGEKVAEAIAVEAKTE